MSQVGNCKICMYSVNPTFKRRHISNLGALIFKQNENFPDHWVENQTLALTEDRPVQQLFSTWLAGSQEADYHFLIQSPRPLCYFHLHTDSTRNLQRETSQGRKFQAGKVAKTPDLSSILGHCQSYLPIRQNLIQLWMIVWTIQVYSRGWLTCCCWNRKRLQYKQIIQNWTTQKMYYKVHLCFGVVQYIWPGPDFWIQNLYPLWSVHNFSQARGSMGCILHTVCLPDQHLTLL